MCFKQIFLLRIIVYICVILVFPFCCFYCLCVWWWGGYFFSGGGGFAYFFFRFNLFFVFLFFFRGLFYLCFDCFVFIFFFSILFIFYYIFFCMSTDYSLNRTLVPQYIFYFSLNMVYAIICEYSGRIH